MLIFHYNNSCGMKSSKKIIKPSEPNVLASIILKKLARAKTSIAILIILILARSFWEDILSTPVVSLIIVFVLLKTILKILNINFIPSIISSKVPAIKKPHLPHIALFIGMFLITIGISNFFNYENAEKPKCTNPYEVKDSSAGDEEIRICNDKLYRGSSIVVEKDEFPDLFEYSLNKEKEPEKVRQFVRVFVKDKNEYISIKSLIDYGSWNNSSIGIYRKEDDKYDLIFKRSFGDNSGRWVNIEFGEDSSARDPLFYLTHQGKGLSISGDIGELGCLGACRMLWWDYYDWDPNKKTFVLSNNKHPDNFKKLLEKYEELDKTTCFNEAEISESISSLYPIRKDKEKICSDNAEHPYTTPGQAEMLLKGKKAIELIIQGENIPMSEVKNVKID
jgi:hypothetical protein